MGKIRAVCCGYYGKGNAGDEALLASLLQMLPSGVEPVVLSGDPALTQHRYGVAACDRMNTFSVLNALRQSQVFIWGGGSLIQDVTGALSPFYYAGLMGLAQKMGLKTIAWAQGIGPLQHSITRTVAHRVFAGISKVSVRDQASAKLLLNWQIPCYLAPDPVWALESLPVPGLWELPAPRVAVTLRSHPQLTPARLQTFTQALINFQKATGTCILLVPFQASQDLAIAQMIQPQLAGPSHIFNLSDPREIKGLFRGVEMAIGMRLHSLIMAAAEECRCFAISYDPKVTQLMAETEMPGWELSALPNDPHIICQQWLEHYVNGDALSPAQIQSLVDRARIHQELLKEVMSSE
jgi:polysaccharide pyruvyl transferase CsaB